MAPYIFDDLLNLIDFDLKKKSIIMRDPIPDNIKLSAALRFLSTGANQANCDIYFGYIKAQSINIYQKFARQFIRD